MKKAYGGESNKRIKFERTKVDGMEMVGFVSRSQVHTYTRPTAFWEHGNAFIRLKGFHCGYFYDLAK
jgi:hypothetical protein